MKVGAIIQLTLNIVLNELLMGIIKGNCVNQHLHKQGKEHRKSLTTKFSRNFIKPYQEQNA